MYVASRAHRNPPHPHTPSTDKTDDDFAVAACAGAAAAGLPRREPRCAQPRHGRPARALLAGRAGLLHVRHPRPLSKQHWCVSVVVVLVGLCVLERLSQLYRAQPGFKMLDWQVWRSVDLVNWTLASTLKPQDTVGRGKGCQRPHLLHPNSQPPPPPLHSLPRRPRLTSAGQQTGRRGTAATSSICRPGRPRWRW